MQVGMALTPNSLARRKPGVQIPSPPLPQNPAGQAPARPGPSPHQPCPATPVRGKWGQNGPAHQPWTGPLGDPRDRGRGRGHSAGWLDQVPCVISRPSGGSTTSSRAVAEEITVPCATCGAPLSAHPWAEFCTLACLLEKKGTGGPRPAGAVAEFIDPEGHRPPASC
jgi:hypothetical protein